VAKRLLGPILGRGIELRLLQPEDLERTLGWRNRDENRRWFVHSDPISLESHLAWFRKYQERDDDFVFVVESLEPRRTPIGQASLYDVDWAAGTAEFGRLLIGDPAARGRGFGLEATRALLGFGFDALELKQIRLEVFAHNASAIKIYQRCGFRATPRQSDKTLLNMELSSHHWNGAVSPPP
jgi:diamine N-acetyltransferase